MSKYRKILFAIPLFMAVGMLARGCSAGVWRHTPVSTETPIQPASLTAVPPTPTPAPPPPPPKPTSVPPGPHIVSLSYHDVARRVVLTNEGPGTASRILPRVGLIGSREPYQDLLTRQLELSTFQVLEDECGNQYAQFEFTDVTPGEEVVVNLAFRVRLRELRYDLSHCQGEVLNAFLDPDIYVESGNEWIRSLASQMAQGQTNPFQTLEALYDHVREHMTYDEYHPEDHGALWALENGTGDCTDFTDALLALSRAAGIPARFLEGVTYSSEEGQVKHDWLEAYLPGHGWAPLHPAWGGFPERREAYFARMSLDHIVVTIGRNPSTLSGYDYDYYRYWWADPECSVSGEGSRERTLMD
jgi:transglutaminase-like putative cysteine protease